MRNRPAKPSLSVVTEGKRHFISVPTELSPSLHSYLRGHGVRCGSPEPAFTAIDTIDLRTNCDPRTVQGLLAAWV